MRRETIHAAREAFHASSESVQTRVLRKPQNLAILPPWVQEPDATLLGAPAALSSCAGITIESSIPLAGSAFMSFACLSRGAPLHSASAPVVLEEP